MKKLLTLSLLLFSVRAFALGRIVSYDEVRSHLFGSIQYLETCGNWSADDSFGNFRILNVYYAGQDMLFVDLIALSDGGSKLKVVHGFSFAEINNDHAEIGLDALSCQALSENVIQIDASATNGHNSEKYKFSIVIDGKAKTYQYSDTITHKQQ